MLRQIFLKLLLVSSTSIVPGIHQSCDAMVQEEGESEGSEQEAEKENKSEKGEPTWQEKIKFNSDLVVKTFKDQMEIELTYDRAGVEAIDGFIERNRQSWIDDGTVEGLVNNLGAFVGECFVAEFGGEWTKDADSGGVGVKMKHEIVAFPFNKIRKHINNGSGDSIRSMYSALNAMIQVKEAEAAAAEAANSESSGKKKKGK